MSLLCTAARRKNVTLTVGEAARFLRQASMGVRTYAELSALAGTKRETWINTQLAYGTAQIVNGSLTESVYGMGRGFSPNYWVGTATATTNWGQFQQEKKFAINYRMLRHGDRLRTKIVRCLHEYFSVGDTSEGGKAEEGATMFDTLTETAFGTFQELLRRITLTTPMGDWLTYTGNSKAVTGVSEPDENYAREIMQLFTIGLWELNPDGTRKRYQDLAPTDPRYIAAGNANSTNEVPTYGQPDIRNMARFFTGLKTAFITSPPTGSPADPISKVQYQYRRSTLEFDASPTTHEFALNKQALYGPAGYWIDRDRDVPGLATVSQANAYAEINYVLGKLASHPSCAPFFCRRMIEMLVTSNPSPAYVARVSSVFTNDGTGTLGNLPAVWKAILLDQEAQAPASKGLIARTSHHLDVGHTIAQLLPARTDTAGNPMALQTGGVPQAIVQFCGDVYDNVNGGRYGMQSMRSVFGRVPAKYVPAGDLQAASASSPETFLLDDNGCTTLYTAVSGFDTANCRFGNLAQDTGAYNGDAANLATDTTGSEPAIPNATPVSVVDCINKWSILLTGDTAPAAFKTSLRTWIVANYTRADATSRQNALQAIMLALQLSPYGMVRT